MNEELKKFNEEQRAKLVEALSKIDLKDFKVKEGQEDSGSFKVIISTEDMDRHGEIVKVDGWEMENYMKNPVVLFGHNYYDLPVGVADKVYVEDGKLIAEGRFAPEEANPFAQKVRKLYDLGMLRTTSVGFIAKEFEKENRNVITKAELLEFSFVPVPANPQALDMAKELGLDVEDMKAKGFMLDEVKHGEEVENAEEKGEVSEVMEARDKRKEKWENFDKVDEIISAFWNVYFNDETEPEEFNALLGETVALLIGLGADTETKSKLIGSIIQAKKFTSVRLRMLKDAAEAEQIENKPTESEEQPPASEPEDKNEEPKAEDEKVGGEGSEEGQGETIDEAKSYHEIRKILKGAVNEISDALKNFNHVSK